MDKHGIRSKINRTIASKTNHSRNTHKHQKISEQMRANNLKYPARFEKDRQISKEYQDQEGNIRNKGQQRRSSLQNSKHNYPKSFTRTSSNLKTIEKNFRKVNSNLRNLSRYVEAFQQNEIPVLPDSKK